MKKNLYLIIVVLAMLFTAGLVVNCAGDDDDDNDVVGGDDGAPDRVFVEVADGEVLEHAAGPTLFSGHFLGSP